jgi:hypothetical protein
MRGVFATGSLGCLVAALAFSCGGATSGGSASRLTEAGTAELDANAALDSVSSNPPPPADGQTSTTQASTASDGQSSSTHDSSILDGQIASPGALDTGVSNDASTSDANAPGGSSFDGSGDGPQSVAQVFASVAIGAYYDPNHNMQNACQGFQSLDTVFEIGVATGVCDPATDVCNSAGPVRVQDGSMQSGAQVVNVNCSVKGSYDVNLQVSLGATGDLSISGHVDANSGGQGLSADINYEGSDYASNGGCSVVYTFMGQPVPEQPRVAPGRIWAHLSCPQMGDPTGVRHKMLMDGSLVPDTCDGEADFLFENCTQ